MGINRPLQYVLKSFEIFSRVLRVTCWGCVCAVVRIDRRLGPGNNPLMHASRAEGVLGQSSRN